MRFYYQNIELTTRVSYDDSGICHSSLFCEKGCTSKRASIVGIHAGWAILFECTKCSTKWFGCNECGNRCRKRMHTSKQLKRHRSSVHAVKKLHKLSLRQRDQARPPNSVVVDNIEQEEGYDFSMNDDDDSLMVPDHFGGFSAKQLTFSNQCSRRYFEFNCRDNTSGDQSFLPGIEYIVKRSIFKKDLDVTAATLADIPAEQCLLFMKLAKMAFALPCTNKDRRFLADVLHSVYELGCANGYATCTREANTSFNNHFKGEQYDIDILANRIIPKYASSMIMEQSSIFGIRIPRTANDIRKLFVEGEHAVREILPHPQIKRDVKDHAYVSIIDCIRDFLAHKNAKLACINNSVNSEIPRVSHLSHSLRAKQIYNNGVASFSKLDVDPEIVSGLILWSDDADVLSTSMQGNANMWCKSLTILNPVEEGNRLQNTYPICLGDKKACHNEVEERFRLELEQLRDVENLQCFYIGSLNKIVPCYFEAFCSLGDQPERRTTNHVSAGNSHYGARFGVSGNHLAVYSKLKSCASCQARLLAILAEQKWGLPLQGCTECLNWDILDTTSTLSLIPLPVGYPGRNGEDTTLIPNGRVVCHNGVLCLKPFVVTYDTLKSAVAIAHESFCSKDWTVSNVSVFLKVEGLNESAITECVAHSERVFEMMQADGESKIAIELDRAKQPAAYAQWAYPSTWSRNGIQLHNNCEAVMHLVFLGLVKQTMSTIQDALCRRSCNGNFLKMMVGCSDALVSLKTDWLKCRRYRGGKFGGWVSQNYLAFSRVASWFYQNFAEAMPDRDRDKHKPPETKPQSKWTREENCYWLRVRDLPIKGTAKEVSNCVRQCLLKVPVPEPVPTPVIEASDVEKLLTSLSKLLECIMAPTVTEDLIRKLEVVIRVYLSAFDNLETKLRKKGKDPKVVSCFNFQCLMNFPNMMRLYGPPRELWEGQVMGEGYLPQLKGLNWSGNQKNRHYNALTSLYRMKAFANVMPEGKREVGLLKSNLALKDRSASIHQHKSDFEVSNLISEVARNRKKPVCVIIVSDGSFHNDSECRLFAVTGDYDCLLEVIPDRQVQPTMMFGVAYYKMDVDKDEEGNIKKLSWKNDIVPIAIAPRIGYGLLLPLLQHSNTEESRSFALVSSNWKYLNTSNTLLDLI